MRGAIKVKFNAEWMRSWRHQTGLFRCQIGIYFIKTSILVWSRAKLSVFMKAQVHCGALEVWWGNRLQYKKCYLIVSSAIFSVILPTVGIVWGLAAVVLVRVGAAATVVLIVVAGTSDTSGTGRCRRRPIGRRHACVSSRPADGIRAVVVLSRVVVVAPAVVAPLLLDVAGTETKISLWMVHPPTGGT